jgi:cytochrome b
MDNNYVADEGLTHVVQAMVPNLIINLHRLLWDALLAAVALHVMTIAIYAVAKEPRSSQAPITTQRSLPARRAADAQ